MSACRPVASTSVATTFSASSPRAISVTSAPACASATAVARPIPEPAPVTMATLPDNAAIDASSAIDLIGQHNGAGVAPVSPIRVR